MERVDLSGRCDAFLHLLERQLSLCGDLMFNWDRMLKGMKNWCHANHNKMQGKNHRVFLHFRQIVSWRLITCVHWVWTELFEEFSSSELVYSPATQHNCPVLELQHAVSLQTEVKWTVRHAHQRSMKCKLFCIVVWRNMCNPTKCFSKLRGKKLWQNYCNSLVRSVKNQSIYSPTKPYLTVGGWWHFTQGRTFICFHQAGNGWVEG